jgi:hypothetical protein
MKLKQVFGVIVATVIIIALSAFAYKAYGQWKLYKSLYEQQVGLTEDAEVNYNRAKVIISAKDIDINVLDSRLKDALNGKEKIVERVVLRLMSLRKALVRRQRLFLALLSTILRTLGYL